MANREELYQALRNADAAGDVEGARKLAVYIKSLPPETGQTAPARTAQQSQPAASQPEQGPSEYRGTGNGIYDAANAFSTGAGRGMLRLVGALPDAAYNVRDLLKAGAGSAYGAVTGKAPPESLQLGDRSKDPLSSDWLIAQAQRTAPTRSMVNPANPDYEGGYVQNAGSAAGASLLPVSSPAEAAKQLTTAIASATAGKGAYDVTGDPALAASASMGLPAAVNAATAGVKSAARNFKSREEMQRRVADLEAAGIKNPTLGLATGNPVISGAETILETTPGAVRIMKNARAQGVGALEERAQQAADLASQRRGLDVSGRAVQGDIEGPFRQNFRRTQDRLYSALEEKMPPNLLADASNTGRVLESLTTPIPGAVATSDALINSRVRRMNDAFRTDATGSGAPVKATGAPGAETPDIRSAIVTQSDPLKGHAAGTPRLPYNALTRLRSAVGQELNDASLTSDIPRTQFKQLYGAMSEDIKGAAESAGALDAWRRTNTYTRAGNERLERLQPYMDKAAPEQAALKVLQSAKETPSEVRAVKRSVSPETWGKIAATAIDRLGKAAPGKQNELGTEWSPETFLTNWNRMHPTARQELLSGFENADQVRQMVEQTARAASMMREGSRMWANPSGTAANTAARSLVFGVPGGFAAAGAIDPVTAVLAAAATPVTANLLARATTSPTVRNALMRQDYLSLPAQHGIAGGMLGNDDLRYPNLLAGPTR